LPVDPFEFVHEGCDVRYGRGRIADLGDYLGRRDLDRALVVCGSNVGANEALMEQLRDGLGDRLVGVFDGTSPGKSAASVFEAIDAIEDAGADVVVGVGGGSSLDTARLASEFVADDRALAALEASARRGTVERAEPGAGPPVAVVPTTLAGADLSSGG